MEKEIVVREETADGITKSVRVEQVENGYIITVSKYGKLEGSDDYIDEHKKFISTKNPFEKKGDDDAEVDMPDVGALLDNMSASLGMINVT